MMNQAGTLTMHRAATSNDESHIGRQLPPVSHWRIPRRITFRLTASLSD